MNEYVYIRSEPGLWTVGFYEDGDWTPESDHDSKDDAAERVAYLNGDEAADSAERLADENMYLGARLAEAERLLRRAQQALDGTSEQRQVECAAAIHEFLGMVPCPDGSRVLCVAPDRETAND
jgi:hypothetical protein